ncbi:DUF1761 domain-containing protein [Aeromicrobium alkaliterrae]|uniref:DUF1761 domain-containing protein n=1 Tax=Aeromicrobium alkaliterrae TaxID=302168 RepID=A0ABN2K6L1_9ACTN
MFSVLPDLSWTGFALATVASIALAGLWFAVVIAKPYLVALGRTADEPPAGQVHPLVTNAGPLVCLVLVTFTSAVLLEALGVTTVADAVTFGLVVGVGYLAAMTFQIAINPSFPRPLMYGLLNAPFFIASSVLSAVIITAFA